MTVHDTDSGLPPHSVEAEQSLLGSVLLNNGVLDRINGDLAPEHFFSDDHRLIYQAQWKLHTAGRPVDVTTLGNALAALGKLDAVGGMSYLGVLVQNVPTAMNAEHYANIIRERAELRRIEAVGRRIVELARTPAWNLPNCSPMRLGRSKLRARPSAAGASRSRSPSRRWRARARRPTASWSTTCMPTWA